MNEFDHHIFALLKKQRERPENLGLNGKSNLDLCDPGAVLDWWSTAPASQRLGFESQFSPKFFRPFSLLLKQR